MIYAIATRVAAYFALLGFYAFVLVPLWNWFQGRGFKMRDDYWVELIAFSIIVVWSEARRWRRVSTSKFK